MTILRKRQAGLSIMFLSLTTGAVLGMINTMAGQFALPVIFICLSSQCAARFTEKTLS
ncbi:hypothetical protein [Colibacter massiliensis]|uniref:hypothetical protein n=1 Tax=Colibacter massiliensis TaxID=1852379 RepID=UPI002357AEB8|nr:hypothetical protein [Colibacter massiliensis]